MRETKLTPRNHQARDELGIDVDYNGRRPPLDYPEPHPYGRRPRPGPEPMFWAGVGIGMGIVGVLLMAVAAAIWLITH